VNQSRLGANSTEHQSELEITEPSIPIVGARLEKSTFETQNLPVIPAYEVDSIPSAEIGLATQSQF
jgi:hypothetical protein